MKHEGRILRGWDAIAKRLKMARGTVITEANTAGHPLASIIRVRRIGKTRRVYAFEAELARYWDSLPTSEQDMKAESKRLRAS